MEVKFKKTLISTAFLALVAVLSTQTHADGKADLTIKETSDSAHANFNIEHDGMALHVMAEFGYFRTKTEGNISTMPMPGPDMDMPFMPGDSEHAYLILHVMRMMPIPPPPPFPMPLPDPGLEPMPPEGPVDMVNDIGAETGSDGMLVDPNMPTEPMPTEPVPPMPPMPPMHEVFYFELTSDQMKISKKSTTVEVDSCQQPDPIMIFEECGLISVNWKNNGMNSNQSDSKNVFKTMHGIFGKPMTSKRKHKLNYTSATASVSVMGNVLTNEHAGRSSSKSTQKFFIRDDND